jgi:hypothetical protein
VSLLIRVTVVPAVGAVPLTGEVLASVIYIPLIAAVLAVFVAVAANAVPVAVQVKTSSFMFVPYPVKT